MSYRENLPSICELTGHMFEAQRLQKQQLRTEIIDTILTGAKCNESYCTISAGYINNFNISEFIKILQELKNHHYTIKLFNGPVLTDELIKNLQVTHPWFHTSTYRSEAIVIQWS